MNRLLVSYDLMKPGQGYGRLIDRLKQYRHARPLLSVWLVVTKKTPEELRDELKGHMDKNDKIIVVNTTGDGASWYPSGIDWIKNDNV